MHVRYARLRLNGSGGYIFRIAFDMYYTKHKQTTIKQLNRVPNNVFLIFIIMLLLFTILFDLKLFLSGNAFLYPLVITPPFPLHVYIPLKRKPKQLSLPYSLARFLYGTMPFISSCTIVANIFTIQCHFSGKLLQNTISF